MSRPKLKYLEDIKRIKSSYSCFAMLTIMLFTFSGKTLLGNIIGISCWLLFLKWLFGLTIIPGKRAEIKRKTSEFRQKTDAAWQKYKDENTYWEVEKIDYYDQYDRFLRTESTSTFHRPPRRFWWNMLGLIFALTGGSLAVGYLKTLSPWLAGLLIAAITAGVFYYGRQHLLYDRWYMKLMYAFFMWWFFMNCLSVMTNKAGGLFD